jgi:hypothetical protein
MRFQAVPCGAVFRAAGSPGVNDRPDYELAIVKPSWAISIDSTATSLPSDFISVPVIFVGNAFASVQTMVGALASSSKLIVIGILLIVFILI